jgi:hypothetical protein
MMLRIGHLRLNALHRWIAAHKSASLFRRAWTCADALRRPAEDALMILMILLHPILHWVLLLVDKFKTVMVLKLTMPMKMSKMLMVSKRRGR